MPSSHKRKEKSSFAARPQELPSREQSLKRPQLLGQEGGCTTNPSPQGLGQLLSKPSLFISHLQVKPVDVSCSGEICITWDNLGLADCSFVPVAPSPQCADTQTHAQPDLWQGWGGQALDQLFPRAGTQLTPPHPHFSGDFTLSSHYAPTGSPKGCQNYYPHLERGERGVRGTRRDVAEANQGIMSKAGLNPICSKLQPGLGLLQACSPHRYKGQLSCKVSHGSARVSVW